MSQKKDEFSSFTTQSGQVTPVPFLIQSLNFGDGYVLLWDPIKLPSMDQWWCIASEYKQNSIVICQHIYPVIKLHNMC